MAGGSARDAQREATRLRILEAAKKLLVDDGLLEVPVEKVAIAAGVSKATVFFHFGSRVGLIAALAIHLYARVAITAQEGEDLAHFVRRMCFAQRSTDARLLWQLGDILSTEQPSGPDATYWHIFDLVNVLLGGDRPLARLATPAIMMTARRVAQGLADEAEVDAFVEVLERVQRAWPRT